MAAVTALILAVVAERMLWRAAELSDSPTVRIHIDDTGLSEDLRSYFAAPVRDHLDGRTIRIEPQNWTGAKALILRN